MSGSRGAKAFKYGAAILLILYVVNSPVAAADNARDLGGWLEEKANNIITFGEEVAE